MIEDTLVRIAVALERLTAASAGVSAAAAPDADAPPAAPRRGRPAKTPEAAVKTPVVEVDPFATDDAPVPTPAKVYTKEDVRAALIAFQKRVSPEKARELLRVHGGVETLASLPEAKFADVVKAAAA